jgi:hypothetical protein
MLHIIVVQLLTALSSSFTAAPLIIITLQQVYLILDRIGVD